ncbi:hypothetical protein MKZ38_004709 [Zalerion maritima]|uniref:Uncharacterized protein n=1 Tax=Zalerion maritima TaxID=339359 RepID=A0AAD5RM96_9PEZI|nr:hypothetical protein MKZ38_004709 [Zalerion maritima]
MPWIDTNVTLYGTAGSIYNESPSSKSQLLAASSQTTHHLARDGAPKTNLDHLKGTAGFCWGQSRNCKRAACNCLRRSQLPEDKDLAIWSPFIALEADYGYDECGRETILWETFFEEGFSLESRKDDAWRIFVVKGEPLKLFKLELT